MKRPDLFRLNRSLHRDAGYLVCVLTALYAASGLAVNHIDSWNPSYAIRERAVDVGAFDPSNLDGAERHVVARLGIDPADVRGRYRPEPNEFKLFLPEGGEVRLDATTGRGTMKEVTRRPFLYDANLLHLNRLKGAWTFVADVFSVLLLYLSVSGLFMLKGKLGMAGRGKWLVAAGLLVPLGFVVAHHL